MTKFVRNLTLFLAGLPLSTTKATPVPSNDAARLDDPSKAVSLRPLNLAMDNLFASHRSHSSHSSHRSHASHYSSSGAGIAPPPSTTESTSLVPAPAPAVPSTTGSATIGTPLQPGSMAPPGAQPAMSLEEKRKLQIMRVQIKLTTLGLYDGQMNGVLDEKTKQSLSLFQRVKGLPESGLMTTPTLNALGLPAVN